MDEDLTTTQAAKLCGRSDRTIRRWIKAGKLPARQLEPNRYTIKASDLDKIAGLTSPKPTKHMIMQARIQALEKRVQDLERQFSGFTHQHILLLEKYVALKASQPPPGR